MKWLVDIQVDEVSLVDKAANGKKFAFVKRDQTELQKNDEASKKEAERAAAEAEEKRKQEDEAKARQESEKKELDEIMVEIEDTKSLIETVSKL